MKIKVINEELSHYNEELKVAKLNYNMVMADLGEGKLCFNSEDVKIIPENECEEAILKCKDVIKIKLHRGMSLQFYTTVINSLEKTIGEEIRTIELLKDEYRLLRKGLWEKLMLLVVNEGQPLTVSVIGRHYGNIFDITITERRLDDFIDECQVEIEWLENEIDDTKKRIARFEKSMENVINNYGKPNNKLLTAGKPDSITSGSA